MTRIKYKFDLKGKESEYFLRDYRSNKNWFPSHVFLITFDNYIKGATVSCSEPSYNYGNVLIGFVI